MSDTRVLSKSATIPATRLTFAVYSPKSLSDKDSPLLPYIRFTYAVNFFALYYLFLNDY